MQWVCLHAFAHLVCGLGELVWCTVKYSEEQSHWNISYFGYDTMTL